jgi:cysteine desulfuration protein SufE
LGNDVAVVPDRYGAYVAPMTDAANPIEDTLADLIEDFDVLEDWEQRIAYVIDLGKGLSPLPDADRIEANKVPGCAAQVWLATGGTALC